MIYYSGHHHVDIIMGIHASNGTHPLRCEQNSSHYYYPSCQFRTEHSASTLLYHLNYGKKKIIFTNDVEEWNQKPLCS